MTKVSIVIPFYNKLEFLKEMVDSIINQSYQEWELLLVNDGADENTLNYVNIVSSSDSRIRVINRHRLPKGAQTCRNIGLDNAIGEYICFFDSDDIVLPHCLQNRINYMDNNPNIDFGVFRAKTFDSLSNSEIQYLGVKRTSDDIKYFIHGYLPFAVWTNIYRTQSLKKIGASWDENILSLQDADFNIQNIVVHQLKYSYNKGDIDYLWRINHNTNSITQRIHSKNHNNSHLYFINKMIKTIHENYGIKYNDDLSLRAYDFGLKFIANKDIKALESLNQMCKDYHLSSIGFGRSNILVNCRKIIKKYKIERILRFIFFPKKTYNRHQIAKKFLDENKFMPKLS